MSAANIAAALGDARREGRRWRCRCPLHGGRSLLIRDGDGGRLLVRCWGGCDRLHVLRELCRRGLLGERPDYTPQVISDTRRNDDTGRIRRALAIWRNTERGASSIVERYLASRGIVLQSWPPSLRFHPRCPRPGDDAGAICFFRCPQCSSSSSHVERGQVAVHCTYLRPDDSGKAEIQKSKSMFGPVAGGAVRFGTPRAGQWLAVAEGIETSLSVATACAMPAWAALSADGIKNLVLPRDATHIVVCADHDDSGTGERAAHDAAARWLAEGRRVRIAVPSELSTDFNNVLTGCAVAKINEARHVA